MARQPALRRQQCNKLTLRGLASLPLTVSHRCAARRDERCCRHGMLRVDIARRFSRRTLLVFGRVSDFAERWSSRMMARRGNFTDS